MQHLRQDGSLSPGEEHIKQLYRDNTAERTSEQGTSVPSPWHGSNRENQLRTEQRAKFMHVQGINRNRHGARQASSPGSSLVPVVYLFQCAGTSSLTARPAGGTITVERLPSAANFWKAAKSRRCRSSHRAINSPLCRFSL